MKPKTGEKPDRVDEGSEARRAMNAPPTLVKNVTSFLTASTAGWAQIWVRLAVGSIFFTQGILKYTDPNMGVLRFARIGFPLPGFTAHFVGTFEIACGLLVLVGLRTRLVSIPLLIVILTAIATTKIPELARAGQGFWFMVSDARTDFAMLTGLLFLLSAGGGRWSLEARLARDRSSHILPGAR